MSDETSTASASRPDPRTVSLPVATAMALLTSMLAGGGGSWITGSSVSAELREFRVEVRAQLDALQREGARQAADSNRQSTDHSAALSRADQARRELESRVRELEFWRVRLDERERAVQPR